MSGVVLPSATTALAYTRLDEAVEGLRRKTTTATHDPDIGTYRSSDPLPTARNDVERRVLALAESARQMFTHGDTVPLSASSPLTAGFSTYTMLGAGAWEWPHQAELLGSAQPWVAEAMRRGSPDVNRGHVYVDSTRFALEAAHHAVAGAGADADLARAYSMGLISATAHHTVVSPVLRGLAGSLSTRGWDRGRPGPAVATAERRVLAELLGGVADGALQNWTPPASTVPPAIHDGYEAALQSVYGFPDNRPPGFAEFEDNFTTGEAITAQRLRSAQSALYHATLTRSWGAGTWWLALSPGLAAVPLSLLLARALPNAQRYVTAGDHPGERGAYEMLTLGMGLGSLAPLGWSMFLWSQLDGYRDTFINALVMGVARVGLTTATLATHHTDLGPAARWAGLWLPMQGIDLYSLVRAIVHQVEGRKGDAFVYWLNLLPTMSGALSLLFAELTKGIGLDTPLGSWLSWILLTGGFLAGVGLPLAYHLEANGGIASLFEDTATEPPLDGLDAAAMAALRGPAALFDESTLRRDDEGDGFAGLRYPSHTRGLVKLWWTEPTSLEVAHDEHTVRLRVDGGDPIDVVLGLRDLTADGLAGRLSAALPALHVEVVDPAASGEPLPFPSTLDDPGDEASTHRRHLELAGEFQPVGETSDDAYVIRHAPHAEQTSSMGLGGSPAGRVDALPLLPPGRPHLADESALALAADLAVLMTMGAAPSLAGAPIHPADVPPLPSLQPPAAPADEVYQVFRRWNLDQRRINEWRMLVAGGAVSEKSDPAAHDPGMRPHPGTYASAHPQGEAIVNHLGWIPAWRAWLRMAIDLTTDTEADTPAPYNPLIPADGELRPATNAELSDAVRYLLDLP